MEATTQPAETSSGGAEGPRASTHSSVRTIRMAGPVAPRSAGNGADALERHFGGQGASFRS
jgi:hypothetical protein